MHLGAVVSDAPSPMVSAAPLCYSRTSAECGNCGSRKRAVGPVCLAMNRLKSSRVRAGTSMQRISASCRGRWAGGARWGAEEVRGRHRARWARRTAQAPRYRRVERRHHLRRHRFVEAGPRLIPVLAPVRGCSELRV